MVRRPTHADALLAEISRLGVSASAEGDRLVLRGPQGAVTPALRESLARHKPEILRRLSERGDPALSFAQERLWLLEQIEQGSSAYHLPVALTLDGRLDVAVLERALAEIMRRHEVLRTTFPAAAGRPVPRVAPPAPHALRRVEVPGASAAAREAEARRLAREEVLVPFDLASGPLFRSLLLRLGPERHVLVLTLHHVVSDGQSVGVLTHEISQLYAAAVEGRPSPLPELPLQYADFARWQRHALRGEDALAQLAYWRRQLAGLPPLELPGDHPRPAAASYRGGMESVVLDRSLADRLRALARAEGATPFMVLLAGFKVLLRRWAGEEDVAVGTPIANRGRPEAEALIGPFVNTLVLRTGLAGRPSFRELVGRVRKVALEAYANQDVPFERLLEDLEPERDVRRSPLFQVFFNMVNYRVEPMELPGLVIGLLDLEADFAKFDLSVYAWDVAGDLGLTFNYSLDRFLPSTARRLLDECRRVLERAVEAPDREIAALAFPPPPKSRPPVADAPAREATLPSRFAAVADRHRGRLALRAKGEDVTYGDLASGASAIARAVRGPGEGRPGRVALLFDHGAGMVAGMLGVLEAGGAYVPLDPRYPRERLAFTADDAAVDTFLTDEANAELGRQIAGPRRLLVVAEEARARGGGHGPLPVRPDDVAYLLYTSGSTGKPKGVVQSHRNVARHADNYARALSLSPDDRLTLLASYGHDAAVVDVFGALLRGASLLPYDVATSGLDSLEAWVEETRPTVYHSTPTVFRAFLRGRRGTGPLGPVRAVVLGGEAASPADVALSRVHFPGAAFVNGLGATESTFHLLHVVDPGAPVDDRVLPVGEPLDGVDIVLLDERGRPSDLRGEIAVRGDAIALGYWRRPDLTAAAFVPDPEGDGGRLYRTGDVGRLRADGGYVFEGRRDLQVKVRGVRVELGEVEAALASHPAVRAAAAALWEPTPGEAAIAGYYVPREEPGPTTAELGLHLRDVLPPAMVPTALVRLDALPLTPSRKVDRKALPPPVPGGDLAGFEPPRSPLEADLAAIFCDLLGVERAGVHDSFFDLGGHSLRATQLVSRIRDVLGVELPLRRVFEGPTVGELAGAITAARDVPGAPRATAIPRLPRPATGEVSFPASFAQQRLWFVDQLEPGSPAYLLSAGVRMQGELDEAALRGALERIVARHETLRTRFAVEDGQLLQVVSPEAVLPFEARDLRGERRPEERLGELAREEAERAFDLARGPLIRVRLLRVADDEHALLLSLHHIVADGWSVGVFVRELAAHYRDLREGRPGTLPEPKVQYGDFAAWQRAHVAGERLESQLAWWRERLGGEPPVLDLPHDRPRPAVAGWRGRGLPFSISAETVERLRALCRARAVTPFMALFAAFAALLARHTGQDDVVIGSPVANRHRGEIEGLVGFFVNALALRVDLSGDPTFSELLGRVREVALGAYDHQDLPFERLVDALALPRDAGRNPVFQVVFALQNAPREALELPGLRLLPLLREVGATRFDLEVLLWEVEDSLHGVLVYSADLFLPERMERLAGHYRTLLEAALEAPGRRLSELPLLGSPEQQRIETVSRASSPAHADLPVHEQVEARARVDPDALAVAAGAARLSYAALDRRANQLAWRLRRLGAGPGRVVAVCLERSAELVVAELAVLKTGAAYLPLDPSHPDERLLYMLEDAGVTAVVAEERFRARLGDRAPFVSAGSPDLAADSDAPLEVPVGPEDLAYVIYTSGSTGRPKGVEVPHRGLANLVGWHRARYEPGPGDRATLVASPAFDASVWETWPYLAAGASLHVPAEEDRLAPERLLAWLAAEGITHAFLPTPLAEAVLREPLPPLALRVLLTGGDRLHRLERPLPPFELVNHYGPTESSVVATAGTVAAEGFGDPPIGRPIDGLSAWVLDRSLRPVPVGVPGELYVGGAGLARGYRGRPELTAERFVPSPFEAGERLYRTGDLVRWDADGALEFLGRNDEQVKVRGHRVELGEIEAALRAAPGVEDAAVGAGADASGETRLVAYVVPRAVSSGEGEARHVEQWRALYDETYEAAGGHPEDFEIAGWNSSYTGAPIPDDEMGEWVETTCERIRGLGARRILEIGCGTGLLLSRLAPGCERYLATDFSEAAVAHVSDRLLGRPGLEHVSVSRRLADDFQGIEPGAFDAVVLNSVVQYFPGAGYLRRVLESALAVLRPGGFVFLGDLRHLRLLEAQLASVQRFRAPAGTTLEALGRRVLEAKAREEELLLDPRLFATLPRRWPAVGRAEVWPKRGRHRNELTRFRYDVVLRAGSLPEPAPLAWEEGEGLTPEALRRRLVESQADSLAFRGVPNARVAAAALLAKALATGAEGPLEGLEPALQRAERDAVDPEALHEIALREGWEVELSWARGALDGRFDAVFHRGPAGVWSWPLSDEPGALPFEAYANDPLRHRPASAVVPLVREHLRRRLPEHMVPAAVVVVPALPLGPTGKVDRRALLALEETSGAPAEAAPFRTPIEEAVAEVWCDVLGVASVGAADDFFAIGGHSLNATQVVSRLRRVLGAELAVRDLFDEPTVAGLARRVASRRAGESTPPPAIVPRGGTEPAPLSFAQQRLWLLDRMGAGAAYNVCVPLRLRGDLDAGDLERALAEIVRRHGALRTRFEMGADGPVQVVEPSLAIPVRRVDLAGVPAAEREAEARRLVSEEARRTFDLSRGPLLRATLLGLDAADHVLVLAVHHVACDGWSVGVLLRELVVLYEAFRAGQASPLPEPEIQYADYARWQREWLRGETLERQLAYWTERLGGDLPRLELPLDRPRPRARAFEGATWSLPLRRELADGVRSLARGEGATSFMVLLGAFLALLARRTGQERPVIGSAIANRNRSETEGLIGFFVNTLVVAPDLAGDPSFREVLARVREAALGAYDHQDLPFEALVDALGAGRDAARNPIFDVAFSAPQLSRAMPVWPGVEVSPFAREAVTTRLDLEVHVLDVAGEMGVVFQYDRGLFDEDTVRRLGGHYEALLEAAVAEPGTPLSRLALASPAERRLVLADWNATGRAFPEEARVHELVRAQARRTPDAPAVRWGDKWLSYADLARRAAGLARRLRAEGVGPEDVVAIGAEPSPDFVAGLLGILEAGAAYLPLDVAHPKARLSTMLADAGVSLLLADRAFADRLGRPPVRTIVLPLPEGEADGPEVAAAPGRLAYVIYTSGSTGAPKGVAVEHRGLVNLVSWHCRAYGVGPEDRATLVASPGFDASVWELWPYLCAGASVDLPGRETRTDPRRLARWLFERGITHSFLPTPLAEAVLQEPLPERSALRFLLTGGDRLRAVASRPLPFTLVNHYGPTEGTVVATAGVVEPGEAGDPPIGRPIDNVRAYVLDRHLSPVPVGVPGELYVGGAGVARGYLGRPDLTAERFVPSPVPGEPGERLYRTGDLVRWRTDGRLDFLGRRDEQVKVRGHRIELGEIESALRALAPVADAVALVRDGGRPGRGSRRGSCRGRGRRRGLPTCGTRCGRRSPSRWCPRTSW